MAKGSELPPLGKIKKKISFNSDYKHYPKTKSKFSKKCKIMKKSIGACHPPIKKIIIFFNVQ